MKFGRKIDPSSITSPSKSRKSTEPNNALLNVAARTPYRNRPTIPKLTLEFPDNRLNDTDILDNEDESKFNISIVDSSALSPKGWPNSSNRRLPPLNGPESELDVLPSLNQALEKESRNLEHLVSLKRNFGISLKSIWSEPSTGIRPISPTGFGSSKAALPLQYTLKTVVFPTRKWNYFSSHHIFVLKSSTTV